MIYFHFRGRKISDSLAVAMMVAYPMIGSVSDGKFSIDVTQISTFGGFFADAIDRLISSKFVKSEHPDLEDTSDGKILFDLVVHLSVCLRPLVHPHYHKTLRR